MVFRSEAWIPKNVQQPTDTQFRKIGLNAFVVSKESARDQFHCKNCLLAACHTYYEADELSQEMLDCYCPNTRKGAFQKHEQRTVQSAKYCGGMLDEMSFGCQRFHKCPISRCHVFLTHIFRTGPDNWAKGDIELRTKFMFVRRPPPHQGNVVLVP